MIYGEVLLSRSLHDLGVQQAALLYMRYQPPLWLVIEVHLLSYLLRRNVEPGAALPHNCGPLRFVVILPVYQPGHK